MRFLALGFLLFGGMANADWISEFGMGYKNPRTTSVVMREECHTVTLSELRPADPELDFRRASCGGDNPAFIGWPIAYEREFADGLYTLRAGWFHYSHWFDGGKGRELHFDAAVVSVRINWSKRR